MAVDQATNLARLDLHREPVERVAAQEWAGARERLVLASHPDLARRRRYCRLERDRAEANVPLSPSAVVGIDRELEGAGQWIIKVEKVILWSRDVADEPLMLHPPSTDGAGRVRVGGLLACEMPQSQARVALGGRGRVARPGGQVRAQVAAQVGEIRGVPGALRVDNEVVDHRLAQAPKRLVGNARASNQHIDPLDRLGTVVIVAGSRRILRRGRQLLVQLGCQLLRMRFDGRTPAACQLNQYQKRFGVFDFFLLLDERLNVRGELVKLAILAGRVDQNRGGAGDSGRGRRVGRDTEDLGWHILWNKRSKHAD